MNILLESRLSDEELIGRTRKRLNTSWKFRVLLLIAGLVWGLIVLWIIPVAFDWIQDGLKQSGAQWRWFYVGMSTGTGLGSLLFISVFPVNLPTHYLSLTHRFSGVKQRSPSPTQRLPPFPHARVTP